MGGWAEGGSSWPHKTQKGSRGILLVSLFDTLTNHSLTIYYNLIYSLSPAGWPQRLKGQRGGAGTPKGLIPILPVLSPKNTTAANAAAAHALVRADKERAW